MNDTTMINQTTAAETGGVGVKELSGNNDKEIRIKLQELVQDIILWTISFRYFRTEGIIWTRMRMRLSALTHGYLMRGLELPP